QLAKPHLPGLQFAWTTPPAAGHATEIAPGVLWLRLPLPFALDHINVWLVREEKGWTLIDTGYGSEATQALWETLLSAVLGGEPLLRIVATHAHPDHIGLAAWLAARFDCPVWATQGEYLNAHAIWNEMAGYGAARPGELYR